MKRVIHQIGHWSGRTYVVSNSCNWNTVSSIFNFLPLSDNFHEEIIFKFSMQHLWKKVKIANQGCLENNGNVWCVKKFNWITSILSSVFLIFYWKFDFPSLKENDNKKHQNCRKKLIEVRCISSIESRVKSSNFVLFCQQ